MSRPSATHAVIVCGHAIFTGGPHCDRRTAADDDKWILQPFQRGEAADYITHIEHGVRIAGRDRRALLLFSGGETRSGALHSEAVGYMHCAAAHGWWGTSGIAERTTTEDFARDSFENVLFGLARFYECTGRFPARLTVISWAFKQARFQAHADALRWPAAQYQYVPVSNPHPLALPAAIRAEESTLAQFQADPTGSAPASPLCQKRVARNPARRQHGYAVSCPPLAAVFNWTGPRPLPKGIAPWEDGEGADG